MEQIRFFHPTIEGSLEQTAAHTDQLPEDALQVAAFMLHNLGWFAQQGFPGEDCTEAIRTLLQQDRTAVVKACAAGLQKLCRADPAAAR